MNSKTSGFRRLRRAALVGLAAGAVAAPSSVAGNYIAGYTDFPNALRLQQEPAFIAGYTDFPNALRVADARGAASLVARPIASSDESSTSTFDWSDAGIGAGATLGAGLLLLGTGVVLRNRTRTVRTH
jgi:hypothetical protein